MNKILLTLTVLIAMVGFTNAQKHNFVNYERDGGWNIGFNMGATWQPREQIGGTSFTTKPYGGFGGGMTLGKSVYEKEGAFFAFDIRGRYLGSYNSGWTGVPDFGYDLTGDTSGTSFGFRNYKMYLHEFSLEGVLTLHRLRERTGILLYGFGGIGATLNKVNANYRGSSDYYYSYSGIDTTKTPENIAAEVASSSDHNFETNLTPLRFSLVPSLGFGIGYQIGPSFSIGFEYKTAFDILGDEFDGGAPNNLADAFMDRYNYASMFFRWNILGGRGNYTVDNNTNVDPWVQTNPTNVTTTTTTNTTAQNKPLVNIYNPNNNNVVVHSPTYTIKAKIYHVETTSGVTFKQNGLPNSTFNFNPATNEFSAQVYLLPGSNVFEITGTNPYGSDQDSRIIILEQQVVNQLPPPIVTFTNPAASGTTVNQSAYTVVANVLNVNGKNDITFTFNGQSTSNFTYNTNSKVLTAVVTLLEGNNTITVKGVNAVGTDVKTTTINYVKPQAVQPPVVKISTPSSNPYATNSPVEYIEGTVHYVNSSADIQVLVNGNQVNNFNYNTLTKKISFSANLILGANVVQITGSNQYGTDAASTTLIYTPSEVMPLPIVDFIVPGTSPYQSPANNITLKATVLNVSSHSNIKVTVNGSNYTAFTFNSITKEVAFNVNLIDGSNVFTVTGTNSAGSDMDEQVIIHKKVEQQPPVVNITNPTSNPYNTTVGTQVINAEILNVTSISGVSAKFNGQAIANFTFDPISHKFVYFAVLQQGANVLEVTGTNTVGTASKSQTIIYTEPVVVCDKPVITITQPVMATKALKANIGMGTTITTNNSKGAIIGTITGAATIDFKINGVSTPGYNYNPQTGKFETFLHLNEGANNYEIIATNNCGTTTTSLTYIYTPEVVPCDNPVINWIYPGSSPFSYTGPNRISASASILGVNGFTNISVKVNGVASKFTFDDNSGVLSFNAGLKTGSNTIYVKATNDCGSSESTIVINFTEPIQPPTVNITTPAQDPYTTFNGSLTGVASVTGVDTKNQVQVFVDGQSITNFSFSGNQVSVPLNLAVGSHHLKVQATNQAGSAFDEVEINVQEQCETPVIVITQPAGTQANNMTINTTNSKGAILANISNASNIIFKSNGVNSTGYNYNPTTGAFECFLHLKSGPNNYEITAVNNCGEQVNQLISMVYTPADIPCDEPTITFVNPATNPFTSNKSKGVTVSAVVTGVSGPMQVVSKVNGNFIKSLYNSSNKTVSFTTDLLDGNNTVIITATNDCGTTTGETLIIFDKPIPAPEVDITTPSQNPYTSSSSNVLLNATVLNVSGSNAVELWIDGQSVNTFTYNYTSKVLTSNLSLSNGQHSVVVKGSNSAGTAQDAATIIVNQPVTPPDVSINNVTGTTSSNPFVAASCTEFNVTGVVANASSNQITYKVDGLTASNVRTLALSTNVVQFTIPVNFVQPGQVVTVVVSASNADGSDSQTEYITCNGGDDEGDGGDDDDDDVNGGTTSGGGYNTFPNGGAEDDDDGGTTNGGGNGNGNNGHGNNEDGVDSSNPGQGGGGPNGQTDASGDVDDEGGNGAGSGGNSGNAGNNGNGGNGNSGNGGNNGGGNGNGTNIGTVNPGNNAANQEKQKLEDYNSNIKQADAFFNKKQYDEAYNYYQKALSIKPNESYPKTKLTAIEQLKQEEQVNAAYNDKVAKGDLYFKAAKYSTAKTFYTQALALKPSATYPKSQIAIIDQKLKTINNQNVIKPNNPIIQPTQNGGKKTNTNSGSGSDTGTKTITTPKTPKTTTPIKVNQPQKSGGTEENNNEIEKEEKQVSPRTIGGGK